VVSLARPGGKHYLLAPELDGKRQEVLIEALPGVRKIAVLADANVTPPAQRRCAVPTAVRNNRAVGWNIPGRVGIPLHCGGERRAVV
jgi:hypothetical protein